MFEHVVVGVDFSPGGDALLRSLPALRALGTRRLTLVHAVNVAYPTPGLVEHLDRERERLEEARRHADAAGFDASVQVVVGEPSRALRGVTTETGASLITVGSRSHNRIVDRFVGDVAWAVVTGADVPVLIQRIEPASGASGEGGADAYGTVSFQRVIFPTDWSETAARAFDFVRALAREGNIGTYQLLHARTPKEEARKGGPSAADDLDRLGRLAAELRGEGAANVQVEAPAEPAADAIVRRADQQPGSLIVMGSHGRGLVANALLGSVSREVVRKTRGSVLLVPAQG